LGRGTSKADDPGIRETCSAGVGYAVETAAQANPEIGKQRI
jgi:hypothetical protein